MLDNKMVYDYDDNNNKAIIECDDCGKDIFEGEFYYLLNDVPHCEDCISNSRIEAERNEFSIQ